MRALRAKRRRVRVAVVGAAGSKPFFHFIAPKCKTGGNEGEDHLF
jgi:hypothetical protein